MNNFLFDREMCFCHYEVYRFQNLVGLKLAMKNTPNETDTDQRRAESKDQDSNKGDRCDVKGLRTGKSCRNKTEINEGAEVTC